MANRIKRKKMMRRRSRRRRKMGRRTMMRSKMMGKRKTPMMERRMGDIGGDLVVRVNAGL